MGLAERRIIEHFKLTRFNTFSKQAEEITQFPITFNVKWDELAKRIEGYSDLEEALNDYFDNLFAKTILGVLAAICVDDMGREALKDVLTKIELKSDDEASASYGGSFEKGELVLNMRYANTDANEVDARTSYLISLVEQNLSETP
jgi:hypothetical protein